MATVIGSVDLSRTFAGGLIMETLEDCGLDDNALAYYQEQIQSQLSTQSPEEA